jgi:hypothetical protein
VEVTAFQVWAGVFILFGLYGLVKGEISWEVRAGPGVGSRSSYTFRVGPKPRVWRKSGVSNGWWVRPFCLLLVILGSAVILYFPGDLIVFTI